MQEQDNSLKTLQSTNADLPLVAAGWDVYLGLTQHEHLATVGTETALLTVITDVVHQGASFTVTPRHISA